MKGLDKMEKKNYLLSGKALRLAKKLANRRTRNTEQMTKLRDKHRAEFEALFTNHQEGIYLAFEAIAKELGIEVSPKDWFIETEYMDDHNIAFLKYIPTVNPFGGYTESTPENDASDEAWHDFQVDPEKAN